MTIYTWTGANGADWSVAADWSPTTGPPGIADTAFIPSGGTVSAGEAESIDVLSLAAGSQLLLSPVPFTVAGSIDNGGLILAGGTLVVAGSVVTLTGNGTLALSGANDSSVIAALTTGDALVNAGAAITGTGTIGGGGLTVTNEAGGVIDAASLDATAATLTVGSPGVALVNAGLLEATTGALVLQGNIANSGTITSAGGIVTISGAAISGGTIAVSGSGLVVSNGGTLDGSIAPVINAGSIDAGVTGVWTYVLGTIENQGSIGGAETGNYIGDYNAGAVLMLSGTVVLTGGGTVIGVDFETTSAAILVNADNTISGSTYDTLSGAVPPNTFYVQFYVGVTNEAAGVINYGAFGSGLVNNDGTIANSGFVGVVDQTGGGTITSFSTVEFGTTVDGVSALEDGATVEGGTLDGSLSVTGTASLDGSVSPVNNAGTITLGLENGASGTSGAARLLGTINNIGTIVSASYPPDPPSGGFSSRIVVASPTVSLTGGGQVQLSTYSAISAAATGDVLVNVDNTISGDSGIGSGGLVLDNEPAGLIEATSGSMTLDPLSLTNAGSLEANGGTLVITTGTYTDLTGTWIAANSTIALPAPNGFAGLAGDMVLTGTAAELVSSTGAGIPPLTNSYLAPQTILAGGVLGVLNGAVFGIAPTPSQTIEIGGATVVTGNSLQPFDNAGKLWLVGGTADLVATVTNTGTMFGYGSLIISGAVMNNTGGTVEANGGLLTVQGAMSGAGTIALANTGTFTLDGSYGQQTFAFSGTSDTLSLAVLTGTNPVQGFTPGNTIEVQSTPVSVNFAAGTLAIQSGAITLANFVMSGVPANAQFPVTIDGGNNSFITETIACFAAGTRVLAASGEVPVEELRIGDQVVTLHGCRLAPIVWVGHRRINCVGHPRPRDVWPIRIKAGAIGDGVPHRDLWLSAEHAILFRDAAAEVLVPVRHLLNGTTIAQVLVPSITYWHVELGSHDAIVAEGLPTETYLDTGNRADFANAGPAVTVHPIFADAVWRAKACAPQLRHGAALAAVQYRLAIRASRCGGMQHGQNQTG